jgi:hypothetical protein
MSLRSASHISGETLYKIQVGYLIGNSRRLRKKEREAATANMNGVGEAVPDQNRANSLNTGWVKVPVKFAALAVD